MIARTYKLEVLNMAGDKTYNGWSNYETWNVNLWLSNDENTYNDVRRIVRDEYDPEDANDPADEVAQRIGQRVRDYVDEMADRPVTGMFADLVGAALSEVDWDEIAAALME